MLHDESARRTERWRINTGLPRHLTVMVEPTAMAPMSTSVELMASVSAAADHWDTAAIAAARPNEVHIPRVAPRIK